MNTEEKDSQLSSDDSDADYLPKEEDYKSDSGSEVSDNESSEGEDKISRSCKRKKGNKKGNRKVKVRKSEEEEKEKDGEQNEAEKKLDIDALWADFKKDVNNKDVKNSVEPAKQPSTTDTKNESSQNSSDKKKSNIVASALSCTTSRNRIGGLSKIVSQIGKKDKMSTLQKSQLDWNNFKKSEGIEEEIKLYNRGKDGYLDKQDFLQRTDLRQFEIEKDLRSTRRKI